jgi:hypothetical protein
MILASMTPLDLRRQPPRRPHDTLDGLVFMPRTIDTIRAGFPGGNRGQYLMDGFSGMMLTMIGVDITRFTEVVRRAASDAEIAQWLREKADTTAYRRWNEWIAEQTIEDEAHRARVHARFPAAAKHPHLQRLIDIIDVEDKQAFGELVGDHKGESGVARTPKTWLT